jgi:hypothetical protein
MLGMDRPDFLHHILESIVRKTLKVTAMTARLPSTGNVAYFQFVTPNGIWRSNEFTVS